VGVHGVGAVPRAFAWVWCRSENSRRYRLARLLPVTLLSPVDPAHLVRTQQSAIFQLHHGPPGWRRRFHQGPLMPRLVSRVVLPRHRLHLPSHPLVDNVSASDMPLRTRPARRLYFYGRHHPDKDELRSGTQRCRREAAVLFEEIRCVEDARRLPPAGGRCGMDGGERRHLWWGVAWPGNRPSSGVASAAD
jgi:hypothetical protein